MTADLDAPPTVDDSTAPLPVAALTVPLPALEGSVERCCELHRDAVVVDGLWQRSVLACCDPLTCAPCCPDCPTCPTRRGDRLQVELARSRAARDAAEATARELNAHLLLVEQQHQPWTPDPDVEGARPRTYCAHCSTPTRKIRFPCRTVLAARGVLTYPVPEAKGAHLWRP